MRLLGLVLVAVCVSAAACQTYDFERVTPIFVGQTTDSRPIASKRLKPNVMLLVDRSLSMLRPIEPSDPACPSGCGSSTATACPSACPTRISELKSAMGSFLQSSGDVARFGVTQYPTNTVCQPADQINVRFPTVTEDDEGNEAALVAGAAQVNTFIQGITTMGGTPTGASLEFVGEYGELNASSELRDDYRDDFVVLLTDGLPNCNDVNPNALCACSTGGNVCTAAQVSSCACTSNCVGTSLCSLGCLDREGVVAKVKKLREKEIRTVVVGFGADLLSGEGPEALNAMAREGGFPRGCANGTDQECGGAPGSCNTTTKQCATSFFQARNATELAEALRAISAVLPGGCTFTLTARPSDEKYLAVLVDGQTLTEGPETFDYDFGKNQVTFVGATCTRLEASTPQRPVQVEFRIVERF